MQILRHIPFLKSSFFTQYLCVWRPAGPSWNDDEDFCKRRHDVTEVKLIDYNAFCQLLPGASFYADTYPDWI